MNATSNPQAAAKQGCKNYRDVTTPDTSVPEAVRAKAEKAVDQSREVYDRSKDALDASVATLERTFDAAGQGAVAFNRKIIDIAHAAILKLKGSGVVTTSKDAKLRIVSERDLIKEFHRCYR